MHHDPKSPTAGPGAEPWLLATSGAGALAAWVGPGPAHAALLVLMVVLCALGLLACLRQRRTLADAARIVAEHRMLRESVEHNPMPFAVYDDEDRLLAWNKAYEATHAQAFSRLRPRMAQGSLRYADLIAVTAEATLAPEHVAAHVAERVRQQRQADGVGVDREYPGLGWLRVCKFATPSGAVAGFAVDINELKQREAALQAQIGVSQALARQLREIADTDALTGAASRRAFFERAADEFQRARRYGQTLSVAMLDIDDFKAVNDRHGHAAGDAVLARVAAVCLADLRQGADLCGRLGGEEFGILLPETGLEGAQLGAERLCTAVRGLCFAAAGRAFTVSVSIGVATLHPDDAEFGTLLSRADAALYRAKSAGRDRVQPALV